MAHRLGLSKAWYRGGTNNYHAHFEVPEDKIEKIKENLITKSDEQILEIINQRYDTVYNR